MYTWNLNDTGFEFEFRPCFGGLTFKNRGHLGSSYIYCIYIYIPGTLSNIKFHNS